MECCVQDCPTFVKRSLTELFSGNGFKRGDSLTVLTVSQKTKNDMAAWSEEVENERESLFEIVSNLALLPCIETNLHQLSFGLLS